MNSGIGVLRSNMEADSGKKSLGAFYTPLEIASEINQRLIRYWIDGENEISNTPFEFKIWAEKFNRFDRLQKNNLINRLNQLRISDPGVGGGAFILTMLPILERLYQVLFGTNVRTIEERIGMVQKHIWGWDISEDAIEVTLRCVTRWILGLPVYHAESSQDHQTALLQNALDPKDLHIYHRIKSQFAVKDFLSIRDSVTL